jgi:hypothetical protein
MDESEPVWRTDNPPDHGYYLGAWKRHGRWVVSELWFNPSSSMTRWWTRRGYLSEDYAEIGPESVEVKAWMPVPKYQPEDDDEH